jgi:hypothetical protein
MQGRGQDRVQFQTSTRQDFETQCLLPFVEQKNGVLRSEWGAGAGTAVRPFVEEGCTTEEET